MPRRRRQRRHGHHRHVARPERAQRLLEVAPGPASAASPRSALVTTSTSGTSMIPAFRNWSVSPEPGCTTTATVSHTLLHVGLRLAHAHGLHHHDVERRRRARRPPRAWRAASPPSRPPAAVERIRMPSSRGRGRSARGRRAASRRSAWRTGRRRAPPRRARAAPVGDQRREQRRLARPRRAGDAHEVRRRLAAERAGETSASSAAVAARPRGERSSIEVERGRRGGAVALAQPPAQLGAGVAQDGRGRGAVVLGHQLHDVAHDPADLEVLRRVDAGHAGLEQGAPRRPAG